MYDLETGKIPSLTIVLSLLRSNLRLSCSFHDVCKSRLDFPSFLHRTHVLCNTRARRHLRQLTLTCASTPRLLLTASADSLFAPPAHNLSGADGSLKVSMVLLGSVCCDSIGDRGRDFLIHLGWKYDSLPLHPCRALLPIQPCAAVSSLAHCNSSSLTVIPWSPGRTGGSRKSRSARNTGLEEEEERKSTRSKRWGGREYYQLPA